jgi:hypothetical protein
MEGSSIGARICLHVHTNTYILPNLFYQSLFYQSPFYQFLFYHEVRCTKERFKFNFIKFRSTKIHLLVNSTKFRIRWIVFHQSPFYQSLDRTVTAKKRK